MSIGHEVVVKLLIENGADVNITNLIRDTPLMLAARKGNLNNVIYKSFRSSIFDHTLFFFY